MPDSAPACPRCQHPLVRSRRTHLERQQQGHRRWRCRQPGCGWTGLRLQAGLALPPPPGPPGAAPDTPLPAPKHRPWPALAPAARPHLRTVAVGTAVGLLAAAVTAWLLQPQPVEAVTVGSHVVHRGTHLEGERLAPDHPLQGLLPAQAMEDEPRGYSTAEDALLRVRRHCAWGLPGRNPYRGSAVQALQTATLSPTVVRQIAADIHAGRRVDRVRIDNHGIRAERSGREFDPQRVAMTYGMTLCVDTRINFVGAHSEGGDLYEAMDDDGRIYAVMVPDVCGNVSVLGQRYVREAAPTAREAARAASAPDPAADPRPWMRLPPDQRIRQLPDGLRHADREDEADGGRRDGGGQAVSAPGSLALAGLALAVLGLVRRAWRP